MSWDIIPGQNTLYICTNFVREQHCYKMLSYIWYTPVYTWYITTTHVLFQTIGLVHHNPDDIVLPICTGECYGMPFSCRKNRGVTSKNTRCHQRFSPYQTKKKYEVSIILIFGIGCEIWRKMWRKTEILTKLCWLYCIVSYLFVYIFMYIWILKNVTLSLCMFIQWLSISNISQK